MRIGEQQRAYGLQAATEARLRISRNLVLEETP